MMNILFATDGSPSAAAAELLPKLSLPHETRVWVASVLRKLPRPALSW
ncbi:MAG: hypothetical protein HY675_22255 [Chloroflexi bacterium]|nr:hypothetical protein [Chloroflexota bacterium]